MGYPATENAASPKRRDNADAHVSKAGVLLLQRQFAEARAEAERAIALNPSQMDAYRRLCVVDLLTGQPESAVACVDKAIDLSPRDPQRFVLFLIKGEAYLMLRQDDQAALSRQMSIGHIQRRISPSAVAIHEQKQWGSAPPRSTSWQYRI